MAYIVREQLVSSAKFKLKCPYAMTPKFITVHNTYNDASAANEVAYHNRNNNATSFHVAVDDKEAIICVPLNRNAFHAGDGAGVNSGNRTSIGVEICYSKSGGPRYKQAEENGAHYVATLLYKYGWGVEKIRQHYNWSGKNCPHRIRDEGRWPQFVARVKYHLDALKGKHQTPAVPQEVAKEEEIELTENGRKACREIIKKAVADKTFNSDHKDVDKYDDKSLISYAFIAINAKLK